MKRAISLLAFVIPVLFCFSPAFSGNASEEKITIKEKEVTQQIQGNINTGGIEVLAIWEIHSDTRGRIGALMKIKAMKRTPPILFELFNKNENFTGKKLFETNGNYVGRILSSGLLRPRTARMRTTRITSEEAKLYLNALEVFNSIK